MKDKKGYLIVLYTVACMMINLGGRTLASIYSVPAWLDSVGTVLMAYLGGPICGAIVGLLNNIIYGIFVDQQSVYCFVGLLIGIVTGLIAKKKVFENPFHVMTLGMGLALMCTACSAPLNFLFFGGETGNVWGDQIARMCLSVGLPKVIAYVVGQFYIEFLDKLICVTIVYVLIHRTRKHRKEKQSKMPAAFALMLCGAVLFSMRAEAKINTNDYNEYTQTVYGNPEGLLATEANDIAQTKDGRIWIGTYAGLYSYDGSKFKLFRDGDSIKNVNTLYVDEEGRLWVGTNDNGFTILINGKVMNVMEEDNGLPSNVVRAISCDSNGLYYVGTSAGLAIVTLNGGVSIQTCYYDYKNINCLTVDENGNVVGVTDSGEVFWMKNGEAVKNPIVDMGTYSIRSAFFDSTGDLYLGTSGNSLLKYSMATGKPVLEKVYICHGVEYINSLYETDSSELFVCTDIGVGYFDKYMDFTVINTLSFSSCIDNMLIDYQGDVWFASSRLGLLKLCKSAFAEVFPEAGVGEHVTNATARWNNMLYCGTDDGLIVIDENNKSQQYNIVTERLQGIRIRGLKVDSKGDLWIATTGSGVLMVSRDASNNMCLTEYNESMGMPGNRFRNIIETSDGAIAISGDGGVAIIRNGVIEDTITGEDGLVNVKSLCLLEYDGCLYIGSDGGGISVVKNGKLVRTLQRTDGLSSNVVMKLVYEKETNGIFAVTSNSICYIDSEQKVSVLDNFPYNNNYDILCGDGGTVWVTGSAGIYVADAQSLIENLQTDYDLLNSRRGLRDSLTANAWNHVDKGVVYLCTDTGVVKVSMDSANQTVGSYRMILNEIQADGVTYEINRVNSVTLPSGTNRIVLEPEILNYSLNDPYISYWLEGYEVAEKICSLSEMEKIVYTNLKPGSYTFHLLVLDGKKERIIEAGSYSFEVESEMYQNWWFLLYFGIVTALMIAWVSWFFTRARMQKIMHRQDLELDFARNKLKMGQETILSIARAVDAKDSNTSEHSFRVSEYSVAIASVYGYNQEQCENLRQMALLHDIGKIGIPDAILNKPAKLTDEEYAIMKTHVTRGGEILKDFSLIENVNIGALYHHERYDGKGYCAGLKGEEIPLEARIIGLADAFDAMTANRVYRKKLDINYVIEELKRCSGSQFDPMLVDILLMLIENGRIDVEMLYGKSKEGR